MNNVPDIEWEGLIVWLETALAFAITMLVFSTIVSVLTETIHRFVGLRQAGLRVMLEKLFDEVIWPRLKLRVAHLRTELRKDGDEEWSDTSVRQQFLNLMTVNRGSVQKKLPKILGLRGEVATSLATEEFIQRLAETRIGMALIEEATASLEDTGRQLDTLIKDVAQKYESFGNGVREYFQRRARLMSVLLGLVLAWTLNVDAVHVFKLYLQDDALRNSLIAQAENLPNEMKSNQDRVQATLAELRADSGKSLSSEAEIKEQLAAIERNTKLIRDIAGDLQSQGIPFGWELEPLADVCFLIEEKDCASRESFWKSSFCTLLTWLLSTTLAGLLIGLGSPFWFRTIGALSATLSIVRGASGAEDKKQQGIAGTAGVSDKAQPTTPTEIFAVAAASAVPSPISSRRPLLNNKGVTITN